MKKEYLNLKQLKTWIVIWLTVIHSLLSISMLARTTNPDLKDLIIDGYLTEESWINATKFSNFIQIEPSIYTPSVVKSEFYFTYDTENIYFAGKLYQLKETIAASSARKDDPKTKKADLIVIAIDPLNNGNSAFYFIINPVNAIGDGIINEIGDMNSSWDAIFISKTQISDSSWTFELKLPLTSISFQNKKIQKWGIMFSRKYAQKQELSINQLTDKNGPWRPSDFYKISGIKNIKKSKKTVITPYIYSYRNHNALEQTSKWGAKFGGEIKYNPSPSSTFLVTVNPDYAQIETDKEVINLSDIPTTYPEKRPFFTEASDMYPGLAVNTRNILDINAGVKFRNIGKLTKLDITSVYDKEENIWLLGNFRITNNSKYHFEIISGMKNVKNKFLKEFDYNVTLHGKLYFFDKRMQVYTWYGTINMPDKQKNEFESVNAIKWVTRNWDIGLWNQFKSNQYNPNIVGSPALSNEIIVQAWIGHTIYKENSFFRKINLMSRLIRYDLFDHKGNDYYVNSFDFGSLIYFGDWLGNWELNFSYKPNLKQKFRLRSQEQFSDNPVFTDAFSDFILVDQSAHTIVFNIKTDVSKDFGIEFKYDNSLIRKSKANSYTIESFIKVGSKAMLTYTFNYIDIKGSKYQSKYRQIINRIKAEYNFNDKMNLRFIYQPNRIKLPLDNYMHQDYNTNLTFSWEFAPGGKLFLVYSKLRDSNQFVNQDVNYINNKSSLVLKLSKSL